jgi:hypothetical protein
MQGRKKMTTWYKLTDKDGYTRKGKANECLWGEGITHDATGNGLELCSKDFIHVYAHPLIAVFMNPIHGKFADPLLWECEVNGVSAHDGQLKSGFRSVTTVRKIDLPVISIEQRIRICLYCTIKQHHDPAFLKWANDWLDGSDRSADAAYAAAEAAQARTAAKVVSAAAYAATAAAYAATAAEARTAAKVVSAYAAYAAAVAVAVAVATAAAYAAEEFDLLAIIKNVVEECK